MSRSQGRGKVVFDTDTLGNCEECLVDSPAGRVGYVAEVRYAAAGEPQALAVRAGRASNRLLIIPISQLAALAVSSRRVLLRSSSPDITATERIGPIGLQPAVIPIPSRRP
jgi:hypothetical protein